MSKNRERTYILIILLISLFLRIYKLNTLMSFHGDIAWDYLSARDLILFKKVPLVGIPTSVPWLHQGSFFTFFLSIFLLLGKFNPVVPAYAVAIIGVFSTYLIYLLGKKIFNSFVGLMSSIFYSTSPFIVSFDRYPYHQSLISFFTILFIFSLIYSLNKNYKYFILGSFLFGLLMQLELSNFVLLPILIYSFFFTKEKDRKRTRFIYFFCFGLFLCPWLPKIIYDLKNNFSQTLGFIAWVIHKLPIIRNILNDSGVVLSPLERTYLLFKMIGKILFYKNFFSILFLFFSLISFYLYLFKKSNQRQRLFNNPNFMVFSSWVYFPILGFWVMGSPSESYIPAVFGCIVILFSFAIENLIKQFKKNIIKTAFFSVFCLVCIMNTKFTLDNNFFLDTEKSQIPPNYLNFGQSLDLNFEIAKYIVNQSSTEKYNLIPIGSYAKYSTSILTFKYLTWYLGNGPSENKEKTIFFIYNKEDNIKPKRAIWVKEFKYFNLAKTVR